MPNNLPPHWSWVKLGDVCETTSGGTPSRKNPKYFEGKIPWIKSGELNFNTIRDSEEKITKEAIENSNARLLPKGTLLIALYGATVGRLAFLGIQAATNQAVAAIFTPTNLSNKFLYWFLFSYREQLLKQRIGGAQPNISQGTLRNISIPLPPLSEQKKIVEKIEELFSQLDSGVAALKKAKQQLRLYRQSVLAAAFSGSLNQDLSDSKINRIKSKQKSDESSTPVNHGSDNLPNGWKWVKLGEVSEKIQYGYTESASIEPIGPKFLRITDIQNGNVNWEEVPHCKMSEELKSKYLLNEGDIVFARTGATVGKSFLITGKIPESVFASYLIRIQLSDIVSKKFIYYFFQSTKYWHQITEGQVGIGQPNVNGTKLSQLIVPLCSFKEQLQIVSEIEKRFSEADNLEKAIDESLAKAETLRQSILKQAFEGKLV